MTKHLTIVYKVILKKKKNNKKKTDTHTHTVSILHGERASLFWLCGGNDSRVVVSISVRQEQGGGVRMVISVTSLGLSYSGPTVCIW